MVEEAEVDKESTKKGLGVNRMLCVNCKFQIGVIRIGCVLPRLSAYEY